MVRLRVLGRIELEGHDGSEIRSVVAQPKRLALLAYLAAAARPVSHRRDTLLALFWPELDAAHGRAALNQAIRFLRKELGAEVLVSRGADALEIDASQLWCDAQAFRREFDAARFDEALDLYCGDLLEGFFAERSDGFEEWLERERAHLRSSAAKAARAVAEAREREQQFTAAVASAPGGRYISPAPMSASCASCSSFWTAWVIVPGRFMPTRRSRAAWPRSSAQARQATQSR
jgi:DNA-binding SARP family transcriptional activator